VPSLKIFEDRWETNAYVLIVCSSCHVLNCMFHVQTEGRENNNVENIGTPEANDCLCAMRDVPNLLLLRINDHNQDKKTYKCCLCDG